MRKLQNEPTVTGYHGQSYYHTILPNGPNRALIKAEAKYYDDGRTKANTMIKTILSARYTKQLGFLILFCALLCILWPVKSAAALSTTFPDATNDPGAPAGMKLRTEVVYSGDGISLVARESDYNVFIPAADYGQKVTITIVDACTSAGLNDYHTSPYSGGISAALFSPDGLQVGGTKYNNYASGYPDNCQGNNLVFSNVATTGNFQQNIPVYGPDYYYLEVQVLKRDVPTPGVKNYSVSVSGAGALVTFAASLGNTNAVKTQPTSDAFAVWDAATGTDVHSPAKATIAFYFNPSCNYTSGNSVFLKWGGADQGTVYQPDAISFDLINTTTGATVLHVDENTKTWFETSPGVYQLKTGMGGSLSYNAIAVPGGLVSGDEYEWRWNDVDHLNGIDIWMPFSDIDTNAKCTVPPTYQCGNATSTPGLIQPDESFQTTVDDTYTGTPVYTGFDVTISGVAPIVDGTPVTKTAADLSYTTPSLRAPPGAGIYTVTWQLVDGGTAVGPACTGELQVVDLPYFNVYGADVSAGGDFNSCTATGGTLAGWYDSAAANAGASTLFAAIALGKDYGFASGQNTASGPPGNPGDGLTFANTAGVTGTSPSNDFGGDYGATDCLFTPKAPTGTTAAGGGSLTVGAAPLDNGAHTYNGNLTLNGGTVGLGDNTALYVTGNVYISSNIIYGTNPGNTWTINPNNTTNVPSFVLVDTGGNIYVDPGVTELDGIYVAEAANGKGGTIYTCGQASFTPVAATGLYDCNNQLTVYGSFIADQVDLMRTFGTLDNAQSNENPQTGTTRLCANGVDAKVCGAEVFDFSPEMYLSNPAIQQPNNGAPTYNSITSLPPVL